ncbi:MBL fold metallo-hydrolase [Neobacillus sp. SAB-20_R2A]|uniref:MBL fold metallo-hydrolase n=1 Tax=Neobacillus sp. SAB-20_R2A TaxID=3120519 RepID=UPI003C6E556E
MTELRHLARFHKAGQGLFFTGSFYRVHDSKEIRYMIDCGSEYKKSLDNEIETYIQTYNKEDLNFLILSHLHLDHVSGLEKLLKDFDKDKINNIFLPYFDLPTRIFLFLIWKNKIKEIDKSLDWVLDFILQPVEFLRSRNYQNNIIFIHDSDDNLKDTQLPIVTLPDIEIKANNAKIPDENELKSARSKNVLHLKNCQILLYSLVEFDLWYKSCSLSKLEKFKEEIKDIQVKEELKKIKKDSPLYELFKEIHKDLNDTSLCVSITCENELRPKINSFLLPEDFIQNHRALKVSYFNKYEANGKYSEVYSKDEYLHRSYGYNKYSLFAKFGYLFTGDINLAPRSGKENDNFKSLIIHFLPKAAEIGILIVPHHGSQYSWDSKLLNYLNNPFCVISSGIENKYRHPDFLVVNDIFKKTGWSWTNNEISFDHGVVLKWGR